MTVSEIEGEPDVKTLVRIHTPEMHNHIMCLTTLAIYVRVCRSIIGKMLAEIAKNPCAKIGMFIFFISVLDLELNLVRTKVYDSQLRLYPEDLVCGKITPVNNSV